MVIDDLNHAWRRLRSKPLNAMLATMLLALGIGLITAMFTIADALWLRPLPFANADRLTRVYMSSSTGGRTTVSPAVFRAWRSSRAFEMTESASDGTSVLESASGPLARGSAIVTSGLFDMLGVKPIRGRLFAREDGVQGASATVIISEDLWRSAWGGDDAIIGKSITVNGETAQVIGVLPSDFRFPRWNTMLWRPIDFDSPQNPDQLPMAFVRQSSTMPRADALRLATDAAHQADGSTAKLNAVEFAIGGSILDRYNERALPLLGGAVVLVFLVLCANVSSLLMVRFDERRHEFSMCTALGASRLRLLRQAFFESTLLGLLGGVVGVAVALALIAAARALLPEAFLLRTLNPLNLDLRAFGVACAAAVAAMLASGLWPAWFGTRGLSAQSLRGSSYSSTGNKTTRALTRAIVVSETALACALLFGAVLLVRSFVNLASVDRGLQTRGVVVATVQLPPAAFADAATRTATTSAVEDAMRRLPGVERATLSFGLPPAGGSIHYFNDSRSNVPGAAAVRLDVESYEIGSDFFELYQIPVLRGRSLQSTDGPRDVVVGERLARLLWNGADPVGGSFTMGRDLYQVIGVVREINHPSIDARVDRPEFYRQIQASALGRGYFMISLRCATQCPDGALIRQKVLALNPAIRVISVGPLDDEYFRQLAAPRAAAALAIVFAVVGVIAAAGGLFGVLSYMVGRRRRELGLRAAIGASRRDIRRLVMRDGLLIGTIGVAIGALGSWWLSRALTSVQYGVSPGDPVSWLIVAALLAITIVAATWHPAARAARVDPSTLLRQE